MSTCRGAAHTRAADRVATRPWFILGARNEIEATRVSGLAAEGEPAERTRDVVNRLVARGHVDYERVLQPLQASLFVEAEGSTTLRRMSTWGAFVYLVVELGHGRGYDLAPGGGSGCGDGDDPTLSDRAR